MRSTPKILIRPRPIGRLPTCCGTRRPYGRKKGSSGRDGDARVSRLTPRQLAAGSAILTWPHCGRGRVATISKCLSAAGFRSTSLTIQGGGELAADNFGTGLGASEAVFFLGSSTGFRLRGLRLHVAGSGTE